MDTYFIGCSSDYITIQLATGMGYAIGSNLTETEIVDAIVNIQTHSRNAPLRSHEEIKRAGLVEAWEIYEARNSRTNVPLMNTFTNEGCESTIHFRESCIVAFRATPNDHVPYCVIIGPPSLEDANQTYLDYLASQS
jgi:hypothetical protein